MREVESYIPTKNTDLLMSVTGTLGIISGVFLCLSVIGLPFGVAMIIGGVCFRQASNMRKSELADSSKRILGWTIYMSIAGFPIMTVLSILSCLRARKLSI